MKLRTACFGNIEIDPAGIIHFPGGVPGFEDCRRFVLLQRPEEAPVAWLQGVDDPDLAFAVVEPRHFLAEYHPPLSPADLEPLKLAAGEEALILIILVLAPEPERITANLQAPVIINRKEKLGAQVYLGEDWPRKYYLFPREGKRAAGT
ncbi:MAG: flagellar assembly protein FliW [bacterium]|jgi:flagellar assembly factor FliW